MRLNYKRIYSSRDLLYNLNFDKKTFIFNNLKTLIKIILKFIN